MGQLCSSPPEPPPNPIAIDLSHFTLLKVVGKGGFGKVNAIQRRSNNELFALKRMGKAEVIKKESAIRMVWTERDIMARLNSPFLVNLVHAFQNDKELFFCMPFMQGGDLRFHLSKLGCLTEEDTRFYTAQILLGLEAMHALNIVYRDLKPDNVLLDADGHLRVSDFGLSVELKEKHGFKIRGNAGTSGYLAPEVTTGEPYGLSCDVWTLGITCYELIHGRRPFKQWKPTDTIDPVTTMRFGSNVSPACQEFIRGLLVINPAKRLGCGKTGWQEVKEHPWLAGLDWDAVKARSAKAPISPDQDAANCSNSADLADQLLDVQPVSIPPEDQRHFIGFEFRTDYQEFLANEQREKNLAGLNMSTATDVGPMTSNASHMNNVSHQHSHMIDAEPLAGAPHPHPPHGSKTTSTAPSPNMKPAPVAVQPKTAGDVLTAAVSSATTATGSSTAVASHSAEKYALASPPPNETHSIAISPAASSPPAAASPPAKQPTSARRRTANNDIPFTRNQIAAQATTPAA